MSHSAAVNEKLKPEPSTLFRWVVLIVASFAMFGNYYIYDSISPVAELLRDQLKLGDADIGMLNAIYSIPNVIMVLIGGLIIDRIGTRISTVIFALLCLVGSVLTIVPAIFSMGTEQAFPLMAIGRLVFGLGAESLIVAVTTALGRWFKGKELSFAFGINLTIARLGTFAALNSPTWARGAYETWYGPLMIATAAGIVCVLAAFLYFALDQYAEKRYQLGQAGETDKVVFKDIFSFSTSYWYIVMLCVVFYSAIFPFQTFAIKMFADVHGVGNDQAGFLSSLLTLSSMIMTPLFGLMADYVGNRSLLMMLGSALLLPVYLLSLYVGAGMVFLPMAIMGIAFALVPAVMWPSVAIIVPESKLGTALGLMTMIQNIGLAGFNYLIGTVNDISAAGPDNAQGYFPGMIIFSFLGFFGMLFALLLRKSENGPNGHGLELGKLQREKAAKG